MTFAIIYGGVVHRHNHLYINVVLSGHLFVIIFRSTLLLSRPNKVGLKCPSVCMYVCPSTKKFIRFQ